MLYFAFIPAGYLSLTAFDWFSNRGFRRAKYLTGLLGVALILLAHYGFIVEGPRLDLPQSLIVPGWFLLIFGGLWSTYALFFDIPFQRTYLNAQNDPNGLITTGLYALSRHPGVLGYALMVPGLVLVSQRQWVLWGGLLALAFDVLHVWVQDRYFLPQMFSDYADYRQTTPFLIPNTASLQRFGANLGRLVPALIPGADRRIQPRYAVEGVQLFSLVDNQPIGEVLDLSLTGMKVRSKRELDTGQPLRLAVRFPQGEGHPTEVEIDPRVVWRGITSGGDYEMGFNLDADSRHVPVFEQAIGALAA